MGGEAITGANNRAQLLLHVTVALNNIRMLSCQCFHVSAAEPMVYFVSRNILSYSVEDKPSPAGGSG